MTLLYDSDNPDSIPDGVQAAGYVNGYAGPAWLSRGFTRFPNARRISVFPGMHEGDTFDVEWLDITAEQAPGEVLDAHARGIRVPWVYVNRANRAAVERALIAAAILSNEVALWVATLDGTQVVQAGPYPIAAVQYANSLISGGHYDLSIVKDVFGPGSGSIGGEDVTPEENLWLKIVKTSVLGPPPASVAGHNDADLLNIFNTTSNANIITAFGQDGYAYMYKLAHLTGVASATEPPETEPSKVVLHFGDVPGTLS